MKLYTRIILFTFLALFFSLSSRAQLVAGFTATPTSGCPPLLVTFSNTSTGATSYRWDLDNGDPAFTLTDVSSSYRYSGTFTATLTAFNSAGDSAKHTVSITVYPLPIVSFTASDTAVCPGAPVTFTSTTIGGVPGAITYAWNFGDGSGGTGSPVSHPFASPGYYNITLTATNAKGCNADTTVPAYIYVYTPPSPGFSAVTTYFCNVPAPADFSSSVTGAGPFTYTWSFGDGSAPSHLADPPHTYSSYGEFNVELTVTDAHGCEDSLDMADYIFVGHVSASFTYPDTACVSSTVTFTNTSSTHTSSVWTYGDGHTTPGDDGTNIYNSPGLYTVRLIVADGPCLDTITHNIYIRPGPTASFTQNPIHPCPPPVPVTFTGTVPPGCTVSWLFGDGGTGTGATYTHTYSAPGVDTIRMIVDDGITGCKDTIIHIDTLYNIYSFSVIDTPDIGCLPLTVHFSTIILTSEPDPTFIHAYPYGMGSYSWSFGDGSATSTAATPSHTYTMEGTFVAVVTALTANGCPVTDSAIIYVGAPPIVTFTATPTHVCFGNKVTYHVHIDSLNADNLPDSVSYFIWDFGDGSSFTDTATDTVFNYTDTLPGVFTVTITPIFHGCLGAPYVLTDYIRVDSPKSIPRATILCSPLGTVDFGDSSLGDNSHLWIFGDGTTSAADDLVHVYPSLTSYTVMLATYNAASGCRDTSDLFIDLVRPILNFTADSAICKYDSTTFRATVTGGMASVYYWMFPVGSGVSSVTGIDTLRDGFNVSGIFTVTLIIKDQNNCLDTLIKPNFMHVAKPVSTFSASPTTGCWPLTVTFTDHSTDIAGATFTNFAWAFGDGGGASVSTPSTTHTFTVAGAYTTIEIVTDNIGCKDTATLPLVTVYRPTASFTASNLFPCEDAPIIFTNTSAGISGSFWTFGDDSTSTLTNPVHSYADTGHYTITLAVTDSHGCSDTAVYVAYIAVTSPIASFTMDDSFSICPPLTTHFTNTSMGAVSYVWDLGDGSGSVLTNPSDFYIAIGLDTITLVATNIYGCTDTAIGHVAIYGYAGGFSYGPDSGCSPVTVHFTATTSNVPNITWDFSDGTTSSASLSDTVSHTYVLPGAYVPRLILSDNTGCKSSSTGTDTIKVDAVTPGFTTNPNPICQIGTVSFVDTSSGYWTPVSSWYWTFSGADTSTAQNPSYTYNATGTFPVSLVVKDGWGCTATLNGDVNVYPPANITVSPDTTICISDKATLTGYGGVSYSWSPTATLSCSPCNPTKASPTVVTTYTVSGTDQHGCINTDTVTVFLKDKTISKATGDTQVCFGIVVPLFDSGATKYTWIPGTGLNSSDIYDPLATPPSTTTYMCIAQLGSCVPDTNYVTIVVHPLPTVNAGADQNVLAGTTAQLQATGTLVAAYAWTDPATLSCDSCADPVASMSVTTTYFVDVTSAYGCKSSDSVAVRLYCDQSQLFIPNTFTPNNDGKDDVFYPRGRGVSIIKSFRIYNRWGELLFERSGININDYTNAWDGTYNGQAPRPDVYVWVIEATCDTGEPLNLKGDVTIIR